MTMVSRFAASIAFWTAAVSAALVAVASLRFLALGVSASMDFVAHNLDGNALMLYAHIGVAPIALALMPFQFMTRLRACRPNLHRWMGRGYVAAVLVAGLAGLQLAFHTTAGSFAATGFALLAVLWMLTTGIALVFALQRNIPRHRAWMLRSAALTFAAVTLRVYLGSSMAAGLDFQIAYPLIAWLCWLPNAVVMEIYLQFVRPRRSHLVSAAA
ncbi:DUF2306 domain-containing protein [Roseibium sp. FZY0029]|uniref:DUF2306 domain-containing protein n=1 Tax=Roseibium sp. FZY0029 TaxID=3116647 RepID=UPI002EBD5032|nr:DUF2306 domain-containing protein [Roseibium sp. FZY0029]